MAEELGDAEDGEGNGQEDEEGGMGARPARYRPGPSLAGARRHGRERAVHRGGARLVHRGGRGGSAPGSHQQARPPVDDVDDQLRPLVAEHQDQDEGEEHEQRLEPVVLGQHAGRAGTARAPTAPSSGGHGMRLNTPSTMLAIPAMKRIWLASAGG